MFLEATIIYLLQLIDLGWVFPLCLLLGTSIYQEQIEIQFNNEDHQIFNTNYDWSLSVKQNIEKFSSEVGEDHWTMYIDYRLHPDALVITLL